MVVLIRTAPVTTITAAEAMRVALGLTLSDLRVTLLFADRGVWNAKRARPEIVGMQPLDESLELLPESNVLQLADRESVEREKPGELRPEVEVIPHAEVVALLNRAHAVVGF